MMSFILQITNTVASAAVDTAAAIQPAVTGIQTATELPPNEMHVFDIIAQAWVIMIPLSLLLLVSIYVMVERLLTISKASKKNATLLASLKDMINNGNLANARSMCKSVNTPESLMLRTRYFSYRTKYGQEIREAMDKTASSELSSLEKNMSVLKYHWSYCSYVWFHRNHYWSY
jgi:biopolymer transport protein ExbB